MSPIATLFSVVAVFVFGAPTRAQEKAATKPASESGYAKSEMLVETDWLAEHLSDSGVRIIDLRGEKPYAEGHIPNAAAIADGPLSSPEDKETYLPNPEDFSAMMIKAGVKRKSHIIVYDEIGGRKAARLWYVLNAYGHENVSLLNGGWKKWEAEKRTITKDVSVTPSKRFKVQVMPELTCASTALLSRKPGVVILDARSGDEYTGKELSPNAAKAGRIPGAVNVEWKENVTGPYMTFKPATELKAIYVAKGITPDKEIIVHCASGGRAAQSLFTLKLLGYPRVKVYYGSFVDYSKRPDAPVEK